MEHKGEAFSLNKYWADRLKRTWVGWQPRPCFTPPPLGWGPGGCLKGCWLGKRCWASPICCNLLLKIWFWEEKLRFFDKKNVADFHFVFHFLKIQRLFCDWYFLGWEHQYDVIFIKLCFPEKFLAVLKSRRWTHLYFRCHRTLCNAFEFFGGLICFLCYLYVHLVCIIFIFRVCCFGGQKKTCLGGVFKKITKKRHIWLTPPTPIPPPLN